MPRQVAAARCQRLLRRASTENPTTVQTLATPPATDATLSQRCPRPVLRTAGLRDWHYLRQDIRSIEKKSIFKNIYASWVNLLFSCCKCCGRIRSDDGTLRSGTLGIRNVARFVQVGRSAVPRCHMAGCAATQPVTWGGVRVWMR